MIVGTKFDFNRHVSNRVRAPVTDMTVKELMASNAIIDGYP